MGFLDSTADYDDNGELLDPELLNDIDESLNLTHKSYFLDSCDGFFFLLLIGLITMSCGTHLSDNTINSHQTLIFQTMIFPLMGGGTLFMACR